MSPVVVGKLSRDRRTITICCPWCHRKHVHGADTLGLRTAHCGDGRGRTYVLQAAA